MNNDRYIFRFSKVFLLLFALYIPAHSVRIEDRLSRLKNETRFNQIFLRDGLSQSIVQCIAQDKNGVMWFGTEDGLNKYDGYNFTVFRSDSEDPESLSYNNIISLLNDSRGVMWVGTFQSGLNRFDQENQGFVVYRHSPENPNSLSDDNINIIYEDKHGTIWVGTNRGINRLDEPEAGPGDARFSSFVHDPQDTFSLSHDIVRSILEDRAGRLWIGTDDGLNLMVEDSSRQQGVRFIRFQPRSSDRTSLPHPIVRSIYQTKNEEIWIGTDNGLSRVIDKSDGSPSGHFYNYQYHPNNTAGLSHAEVYVIVEDQTGLLWIGTNGGGLNVFDRNGEKFISFRNDPEDPSTLSYDQIRAIYEDSSGLIWIGTYGGGIDKVDRRKKLFYHYQNDPQNTNSLNQNIVWSILEDPDNILWIGTNGGGLNKFDRDKNRWWHFLNNPSDSHSLSHNIVRVITRDKKGQYWLGTHGGGVNLFDPRKETFLRIQNDPEDSGSLSHNQIRTIFEDRSGTIWIGTYGGGLNRLIPDPEKGKVPKFQRYVYDPADPTSLSNNIVRVVYEDRRGTIWLGTEGGGLNRFDPLTEKFYSYKNDPGDQNSISSNHIFSILEDRTGNLWLSTWGGGLNKFDRENNRFIHYTRDNGLPSDAIYGILEDKQGNLWLSSNAGLTKFDPIDLTIRNYDVDDGLQSDEFNGGSFFRSIAGEMFFGGIYGFNTFYPDQIEDNTYIPPVIFTGIKKLNQPIALNHPLTDQSEITFTHKDYVFSIEFAALDYTTPMKNKYAYKMEGLDENWVTTDAKRRFATYTTLPPGEYIFRVKGSNNDGLWNEQGTALKIIILPQVWQTWWFRAIIFLVIIFIVYLLYKRHMKNIKMKTELQTARKTQMSIMPGESPQLSGFDIAGICIPANEVGGDFFDYFWMDDQKQNLGIAVGDVSGKAMKAAMIAVLTDGMLCSLTQDAISTDQIMSKLNRPLYTKLEKNMFTALLLASLETKTRTFRFTNAGINEPLLKSAGKVNPLASSGPRHPLGAQSEIKYKENLIQLKPGDTLVIYSDGVVETRNSRKESYEEKKLIYLISQIDTTRLTAEMIKDAIVRDVDRFRGNAPRYDDMTVIVVNVKESQST